MMDQETMNKYQPNSQYYKCKRLLAQSNQTRRSDKNAQRHGAGTQPKEHSPPKKSNRIENSIRKYRYICNPIIRKISFSDNADHYTKSYRKSWNIWPSYIRHWSIILDLRRSEVLTQDDRYRYQLWYIYKKYPSNWHFRLLSEWNKMISFPKFLS